MKIGRIRTLNGANIYSHNPVIVMRLNIEDLSETRSHEIPGFIDRLLNLLPGLCEHRCDKGEPGGFVEQLQQGTLVCHVVEHVVLELTGHAGIPADYSKTTEAGDPCCYNIVVEHKAEQGTRYLLEAAVELVEALIKGEPFPLAEKVAEARRIVAKTELGPSTKAIIDAAERRGIPWVRINGDSLVRLGYGKHRKYVQAAMSEHTSAIAMEVASDKELTKRVLEQASIPVPRGTTVRTEKEALAALEDLGAPVVVKPLDGCQGKGVSLNLTTTLEVAQAFRIAREFSSNILVEELLIGHNYRVLIVNGKMIAASERLPAHVVGDGQHTIKELIDIENEDPRRGDGHEKPLTRIKIDSILLTHLEKSGLSLDHIPENEELVFLREGINLSTGGTAKDVTDIVHPDVKRLSERVARVIGLDICGVDLVLKDIMEPLKEGSGGVIEVNASPGLRMHHYPSEGRSRDVGAAIVDMLYPPGAPSRIPLISITGTNGKTTVTRMIAHILSEAGNTVGMTTTDGIYIGGERIASGDMTGPHSARTVLSDTSVDVAVLETARGGIARRGLGYDWSDISVMTNIQPDHIGQDGIKSVEDLVNIKSLLAERVREGGTLILNADDERLARLMDNPRVSRVKKEVVYFSIRNNHLLIKRHTAAGGTAYFVKNGWIMECANKAEHRIIQVSDIPVTMYGTAEFQIANSLAAIAASRAHGITRKQVAAFISSFQNDVHNPGRANLFRVANGYIMLDYGHNPDAFKSVCRMTSLWQGRRVTGIVGVPGDRADSIVVEAGRAAAKGFHRIIIKEDKDLRGRAKGEIAGILCEAIKEEAPDHECSIVLNESEAIRYAIESMTEGEIVVVFYDKLEPVIELLKQYGAVAASTLQNTGSLRNVAARRSV
jgi:cyanophycin synthetase